MALVYPGSAAIPQYESSLAAFMPAFEAGQKARTDANAFDAAAKAFGGPGGAIPQKPASPLEQLMGLVTGKPSADPATQPAGPFTRPQPPQNAVAAINQAAPVATPDVSGLPPGYLASARASESGGNDRAANPNSSALGRYQFLESTWNGLAQQYPELQLTADGRTDPDQQERAMAQFTQDNARALSGAGIPVDPGTLYAAHFLGAGGAQKALSADPSTPMSALVDPGVIQANPQLAQMSAGDFAQWAQRKGGNSSGGYAPPTQDVGAGQGRPFQIDEGTMRTLLASDATRPLAVSLIQAQQETQASQGRFVTEQGDDGAIWQRDTLTGEQKVIREPQAPAQRRIVQGPDGNSYYEDGARVLPGIEAPVEPTKAPTVQKVTLEDGSEMAVQWDAGTEKWVPIDAPEGGGSLKPGDGLTEGQAKLTLFQSLQTETQPVLLDLEGQFNPGNLADAAARSTPIAGNFFKSEQGQIYDSAATAWAEGALRIATGAAATPEEMERTKRAYFAQPGDTPNTIAFKAQMREMYNRAIQRSLGQETSGALPKPSEFANQIESQALPEGVTEEDIEYTMQVHGLTREQVLERLNAAP